MLPFLSAFFSENSGEKLVILEKQLFLDRVKGVWRQKNLWNIHKWTAV